ncbi:hypothetical protein B932_3699 (plasmid) [Gluconobacter oxydans H24]|nr:hypothetical protein B932_3699 [Gluconobacter oxydans H24]
MAPTIITRTHPEPSERKAARLGRFLLQGRRGKRVSASLI